MPMRAASILFALVLTTAAVTCLGASALAPATAGEREGALPRALASLGFGAPRRPVTVEFIAPIGEAADHPRLLGTQAEAPAGTRWVFEDPAPVLAVLARAHTRHYAKGMFPGAKARLRIDASDEGVRRVIHVHYKPGHGDILVRRGTGAYAGGGWTFDPAADRALVALLSKTKPSAIGAPSLGMWQLRRTTPRAGDAPVVFTLDSAAALSDAKATLAFRYPSTSAWKLPTRFDWRKHVLVGVELPAARTGMRLDWDGAVVENGVLIWRVRSVKEDRKELLAKGGSVLIAALPRSPAYTRIRAQFDDGTTAEVAVAK